MSNLQKQNLSHSALLRLKNLKEISGIRVRFDNLTVGSPSQFLSSYKLMANGATQSILYNGSADDIIVYASISGVLSGNSQAQLLVGDFQTLQGMINGGSVLQTINIQNFMGLPKYQQFTIRSGHGMKLSLYDSLGQGDYMDVDVSIYKNRIRAPYVVS